MRPYDVIASAENWSRRTRSLEDSLMKHARLPLCVTDPNLDDNPIVFVNDAFSALTGYGPDEVMGRNCRFLQGTDTTADSVTEIKRIIAQEEVSTVELVNYRKDGTRFINALQLGPIYDDDNRVAFFFGSQLDVTAERERQEAARQLADNEFRHRLRNLVSVMSVLVRLTGREEGVDEAAAAKIVERLKAVGDAHVLALTAEGDARPDLATLVGAVLSAYAGGDSRRMAVNGPEISITPEQVTLLAMVLHELATNSVKHGALSRLEGGVALDWEVTGGAIHFHWRESGGPAVVVPSRASGSQIVRMMFTSSGGALEYDWQPDGLVVRMNLPHKT